MKTAWTYAHHYPGLGALQAPWGSGGSRGWHVDADGSGEENDSDLNAFVIRLVDPNDPTCYATWPGGEPNEVPAQTAQETGRQLLANVDVSRWGGLLEIETGLTVDNLPIEVREYWQAVRDYQTTPHVDPLALDFGDDFLPIEILTLAINDADCENVDYHIDIAKPCATDPNWLTISPSGGQFTKQAAISVRADRSPIPTGGYTADLVVYIGNDPEPDFLIPVTMTKPRTNPPITARLEIGSNDPNDPNIVTGLAQWQRITDTACIEYSTPVSWGKDPNEWFAYWHAALVQQTGRDMRILGFVKANGPGCVLDNASHWQGVAADVEQMVAWTGENTVFLDTECLVRKYTPHPGDICPHVCDGNDPNFNLGAFATAMGDFVGALDPNITILWYRGVSWETDCGDPNTSWELAWTEQLLERVCPIVYPRIVSLTYDGESCLNHPCALAARDWEDDCADPNHPMFPIIYIGDPNDRNNETPEELGDYWTWEQAQQVLNALATSTPARQDAIFYPGHEDWLLTGQNVADKLWPPNQ